MEDFVFVGGNFDVVDEGRVVLDVERVVGEIVWVDDFVVVRVLLEVGDLRVGVDVVDVGIGSGVLEVDVVIVWVVISSKEVYVLWVLGKSFDGGFVVGFGEFGNGERVSILDGDKIVIVVGSKLGIIRVLFKVVNFRGVRGEFGNFVFCDMDIMVED